MPAYPGRLHKKYMRKTSQPERKRSIQMNRRIIAAIAVIIGLGTMSALVYAGMGTDENKQKVAMTDLPTAVQKTIEDNLAGGTVTEIAKGTKDGKTFYEAQVQKSGGEKAEIMIAEDGTLINVGKEEDEDDDD
jgi:uncharacterized membrane protein YkoI